MNILALKLILAPIIIGSASLAGRKWGSAVSGWLIGLPLTSGPVAFFLALSHNKAFAYNAVRGVLSGGFSLLAYSLVYAWLAKRFDWRVALFGSIVTFSAFTTALKDAFIPFIPLFLFVLISIFITLTFLPKNQPIKREESRPSRWDIPARILIGTSFILFVTGIAPFIGAQLTGLLTTFPLYASILTVFAHRNESADAAIGVVRGLVFGLFAFTGFYLVLGSLIEKTSLAISFGAAAVTSLAVQGATLFFIRKRNG